ncbi:hypothetical protein L218DRAFT_243014 [Marasmius fiardii PR-910]|nr:hypothetical protein L218DRAFT_243014 [Marasmius fiardii PR-910]
MRASRVALLQVKPATIRRVLPIILMEATKSCDDLLQIHQTPTQHSSEASAHSNPYFWDQACDFLY